MQHCLHLLLLLTVTTNSLTFLPPLQDDPFMFNTFCTVTEPDEVTHP